MRHRIVRNWQVLLSVTVSMGGLLLLHPFTATALQVPAAWRHHRHAAATPAAVHLQAARNPANSEVVARVRYTSEQRRSIPSHYKIVAVEICINGTPRYIKQFKRPSAQGNIDATIALSSLPTAERVQPLSIQAKTYTRYHFPHHKLAASSNTVTLPMPASGPTISWAPQALGVSGFAGTMQSKTVEVTTSQQITGATFHVSAGLSDMVLLAGGETGIAANTPYTIPIAISIPAEKAPGTYNGTLELHAAGQVVAALPLTITVINPSATTIPADIANPTPDRIAPSVNGSPQVIKDEVVVGLRLDIASPEQRIREIAGQTGGVIIGAISTANTYQLRFTVANLDELKAKRDQLENLPDVSFATRNFASESTAIPEDAEQPESAWLDANHDDRTWGQRYINLPAAWNITTGNKNTKLGVLDVGFRPDHEDLINNIVPTADRTSVLTEVFRNGGTHGTKVAGVMCAQGNNNLGIAGVNWNCSLGLYNEQIGAPLIPLQNGWVTNVMHKMIMAAGEDMRVVNISFGWNANVCEGPTVPFAVDRLNEAKEINKSIAQAILWAKGAHKDVLWVIAAGNACRDVQYVAPASIVRSFPENVITVAAIKQTESAKAALEEHSDYGGDITLAAPGERIYTTSMLAYDYDSGTSLAAPFVSGVAGLVLSAHSGYTATQVKECILNAAASTGHEITNQPFRVIDAAAAVACSRSTPPAGLVCVFERGVRPDGCESTNRTVEVDYFNSGGACRQQVHITWNRNDPTTEQVFDVTDVPPGGSKVLGTHTYPAIPSDYWIEEDVTTNDGTSCLFVALSYLFRLKPNP